MTSYPSSARGALSESHQQEIYDESGVDRAVGGERGYETVKSRSELLEFKGYQRRIGLRVPMYSPDGITRSSQLKPRNPRKDKKGKPVKYETAGGSRCILDVHPRKQDEARHGDGDLWVTEGIKKSDSLTSRGPCTVGLIGVWNWQRKGEMLECWKYIRLEGRRVYIVFDSDVMVKPEVQLALERLVAALEVRGADVMVVYLPGPEKGVDDYLVAGHSVAELKMLARKFEPSDFARVRLSRDKRLQRVNTELWGVYNDMPARKNVECTNRAIMRDLISAGEATGKLEADGIGVIRSMRDIANGAQVSLGGAKKGIDRLEKEGYFRKEKWGKNKDKPGRYVLLSGRALREHNGRENVRDGKDSQEREAYDHSVHVARAPSEEVPKLRWPKVVHTWEWKEGRRIVVDSEYVARLGKRREEIIRYLLDEGGAEILELLGEFGAKTTRRRDFCRRMLGPLVDEGIVCIADGRVNLTAAWREALEDARERSEEIVDARLQAERFERQKKEFKKARKVKADPTPELKGREHVKRIYERHGERWKREAEEKTAALVRPAEEFVRATLEPLPHIRLGLLEDIWRERGGHRWHLRLALRNLGYKPVRHAEHPGEWFVYPPELEPAPGPEPVMSEPELTLDSVADWRDHPLDCECAECEYSAPKYVMAYR